MSWMIARNRSGWLNCRFHMNSSRYSGMLSYRVPFIRLSFRFTALQRPSTVLVCTPVKWSTKFSEWFTVRWKYPWLCSVRYGVNSSECIVVPGKMWRCIIGSSVWRLRFGTLNSMTVKTIERACRQKLARLRGEMAILRINGRLLPLSFEDSFFEWEAPWKQRLL